MDGDHRQAGEPRRACFQGQSERQGRLVSRFGFLRPTVAAPTNRARAEQFEADKT